VVVERLGRAAVAEAVARHKAAGRSVYYSDPAHPGYVIEERPDRRRLIREEPRSGPGTWYARERLGELYAPFVRTGNPILFREPIVFDGRNLWEPAKMRDRGFHYFSIGRPPAVPLEIVEPVTVGD
jgi:hypothetical protein